jgi:hypothetical protein
MSSSNASPKKRRTKKAKAVSPPVEKTAEKIEAEDRAKVKSKLAALYPTPTLLGKPLSMGPLSVEHYVSVLHR